MTVEQLIEELKKCDPRAIVWFRSVVGDGDDEIEQVEEDSDDFEQSVILS